VTVVQLARGVEHWRSIVRLQLLSDCEPGAERALSTRRLDVVREKLVSLGVAPARVSSVADCRRAEATAGGVEVLARGCEASDE
jgi:hypothetical protein